jgi:hypothetical protein
VEGTERSSRSIVDEHSSHGEGVLQRRLNRLTRCDADGLLGIGCFLFHSRFLTTAVYGERSSFSTDFNTVFPLRRLSL